MAVRLFFFLLVLANLLFFSWAQGYFGPTDENREPQRLEQQLQADKLRLLPAAAIPATKADPAACRVVNGLAMVDAEALKLAVAAAGGEAQILPLLEPKLHLVVIMDLPNQAAAEKKAAELRRFGVTEQETVALNDGSQEIVLGSFPTETPAREFLLGLNKRGIKSARVDSRDQPPLRARLEARAPASILLRQLPQLMAPYADATLSDCAR